MATVNTARAGLAATAAVDGDRAGLASGGGSTSPGGALDQTQSVAAITRIFDVTGASRPIAVDFTVGSGDSLDMFTSTDAAALSDENHASWVEVRATSGISSIEFVTSVPVVGIRVRRTAGSSTTSAVRVYSEDRGTGYNPVYDPSFDVSPAGLNDTRRFLDQATMGPLALEAAAFSGSYGAWIDAQAAMPAPTMDPIPAALNDQLENGIRGVAATVFQLQMQTTNQLRARMAHVLFQIIPVAYIFPSGSPNLQTYHQGLVNTCLSNFRDVLLHVSMNRAMGYWLNNIETSAWNGTPPSQNFVRELLQLFSMGTIKLNRDGTPVVLPDGRLEPAYTQDDVNAAARLMAGWSQRLPVTANPGTNGTPANGDMETSRAVGRNLAYNGPALTFMGFDETTYPSFGQIADPTNAQIIARRDAVLDIVMAQQTTAVYVCKQFIKKMVTDSPTPQYIRRVVAAFENNGSGVRGDLVAVVKAVLLDPEARGNAKPATSGRAQEWQLSMVRRYRYATALPLNQGVDRDQGFGLIWHQAQSVGSMLTRQGQRPATPTSVFYDFPFEFSINGVEAPTAATWTASAMHANIGVMPSFSAADQLSNTAAMTSINDNSGRWLATELVAVYEAAFAADPGNAAAKALAGHNALLDKMYPDLHQGSLPTTAERAEIITSLTTWLGQSLGTRTRVCWLINLLAAVPRAAVVI